MISLQNISYAHPNGDVLFSNINLTINRQERVALLGNNGAGKSTLLALMAGQIAPKTGELKTGSRPYYVPQLFGRYREYGIARALGVEDKLLALRAILAGDATEANFATLDDDWTIEERCHEALASWQLDGPDLSRTIGSLSGGQAVKVFLAGITIHRPEIVLLDEPSNHLDGHARKLLYDYVQSCTSTLVVVSHDRTLLNLLPSVYELSRRGVIAYGGNYDFYAAQKAMEEQALNDDLKSREKALRKAREVERETIERQQKLDARGRKKQEKAGLPTISLNTFRNNAEKSTSRMKDVHAGKISSIENEVNQLRKELPVKDRMKLGFDDSSLHTGKVLVDACGINYTYNDRMLWDPSLSFQLLSGKRIAIDGANGSGKTTLVRLLLGELEPASGSLQRADLKAVYVDQDYSLVDNARSVYEQAQLYNDGHLQEHEVKSRLTHFLFTESFWDKPCAALSGGEKMRMVLCCLTIGQKAPDLVVLDEPTNNLDLRNIDILTTAINDYTGTLVVISHDARFLEEIGVNETITLE